MFPAHQSMRPALGPSIHKPSLLPFGGQTNTRPLTPQAFRSFFLWLLFGFFHPQFSIFSQRLCHLLLLRSTQSGLTTPSSFNDTSAISKYRNTTTYQTHTHTHSFTFGGCSMFPEVSLSHTVRRVNICNALAIGVVRCLSNSVVYCCRENRWQSGFHFPAAQQASDALWSRYCVTIWNWCILLLLLALMSSSCPGSLHSKLEVRATPSSVLAHCSNSNKHPKTHPSGAVVAASMPERSPRKGPPRSLFVFLILIYFLFD